MEITFTIQDLGIFIGWMLLLAVGVFLILVLWKLFRILGRVQAAMTAHHDDIDRSIKAMPGIMENAEKVTENLKDTTDQIAYASEGVGDTVDVIREGAEDFGTYFHIISEIIKVIVHAFSGK